MSSFPIFNEPTEAAPSRGSLSSDGMVHDWYTFVLSFPPHLVRHYLSAFGVEPGDVVLDPFCGTGTTLVECKKLGIASVGVEAAPMAAFASATKVDWVPSPLGLLRDANRVAEATVDALDKDGLTDAPSSENLSVNTSALIGMSAEAEEMLIRGAISPLPLHKFYRLMELVQTQTRKPYLRHELLALAAMLPTQIGNLRFGPEVGIGAHKTDAAVVETWLQRVQAIARDLSAVRDGSGVGSRVVCGDARNVDDLLARNSIAAVFTSPPYPNEKDYTRIARLESVLLGFFSSRLDLRDCKKNLVRSNTRGVYKGDDDDTWIADSEVVQRIAADIEERRIALGKDSGFERLYARVTRLYFGGMKRHLANLRPVLKPGALLGYVVGDQASYLRIMIRTGEILAQLAEELGYEVLGIDLFRTRMATATRSQLREEVLILRWPGGEHKI